MNSDVQSKPSPSRFAGVALILIFTALYAAASIFRHSHFGSYEDLAMFDQMLWNVREGRGLLTSISGNPHLLFSHHFFSEHVSPILYLLAWPAGLTSGPEALLVIQALALALSAWPAARIVAARFHSPWGGILIAAIWLSLPGLWRAGLYDFHMEVFEAFFLFAFWLALMKGRMDVWFWAALYVACKEDAPLYLAFAAAAGGWIFHHRRLGFTVAAVSAVYAALAIAWIGPSYSDSGQTLVQARLLTPTVLGGIDPWLRLVALSPDRWIAWGRHLIGFAGLPLLGGLALLPGLAATGIMWLSGNAKQFTIDMHYPFTVYPLLFLAAVEGARRLTASRWATKALLALTSMGGNVKGFRTRNPSPLPSPGGEGIQGGPGDPFKAGLRSDSLETRLALAWARGMGWALSLGLLVSLAFAWHTDGDRILQVLTPPTGLRHRGLDEARAALSQIPANGTLTVSLTLSPHVARREALDLLISPRLSDWLAVRTDGHFYPLNDTAYNQGIDQLMALGYGFSGPTNSFIAVFQKGGSKALNPVFLEYHHRQLNTLEAESLLHQTGRSILDPLALNEYAWQAHDTDPQATLFFGRYLDLPAGPYRVFFRVRSESAGPDPVARLDVTEERGRHLCGVAWVSGSSADYQELTLDVTLAGLGGVEFRGFKIGPGSVTVDSIRWSAGP